MRLTSCRREQALDVLQDESLHFTLINADNLTGEKLVYPPAYRKTSSIDARTYFFHSSTEVAPFVTWISTD